MSDVENPPMTGEEPLVPTRTGGSLLERWVESGPDQALQRVDALVKTLEVLRLASIRATYPSDWLIHVSVDHDGAILREVAYLQDCGAQRAGEIWGIEVGMPAIEREDHPDGTYSYHMLADGWSKVTGERIENAEGSRWSGAKFFERRVAADEKVDPTVVRKSAYANLHGRVVRALGGLSAVPPEVLRAAGLDLTKVLRIGYEKGGKGGESTGAGVGTAEAAVGFGNAKGQTPAQLSDKDLAWYLKAYAENVADPTKARFARANQRVLDALTAEQDRRAKATAHEAATGMKAEGKPVAAPSRRSDKLADLLTRLSDASGKNQRIGFGVLRLITKEHFGTEIGFPTDLTDEQLDWCNTVPEDVLKAVASRVKAPTT